MASDRGRQEGSPLWDKPLENLDDVISCVRLLLDYVSELESRLSKYESGQIPTLRKLEYRIGKLFIKELSGTLNIGITSIDRETELTDLSALSEEEMSDSESSSTEESWYRDEGWFTDT